MNTTLSHSKQASRRICWPVPVFSQATENLCWEACARMMWHWRHRNQSAAAREAGYRDAAGSYFLGLDRGLSHNSMNAFYQRLGMRHVPNPDRSGLSLRVRLRSGPVIFTSTGRASGHAMVATCYNPNTNTYRIINPCRTQNVTFGDNGTSGSSTCTAGSVNLDAANIDARLGGYIWHW
ncbi:MAG: hypothetical protein IIA67_10335 [Planctomycetes bacterium]|nr:hypothetical protein [Planctomycetota bacterium]